MADAAVRLQTQELCIYKDRLRHLPQIEQPGADVFVFESRLLAANLETVTDFTAGDTLRLDDDVFTALIGASTLTAAQFVSGAPVRGPDDPSDARGR